MGRTANILPFRCSKRRLLLTLATCLVRSPTADRGTKRPTCRRLPSGLQVSEVHLPALAESGTRATEFREYRKTRSQSSSSKRLLTFEPSATPRDHRGQVLGDACHLEASLGRGPHRGLPCTLGYTSLDDEFVLRICVIYFFRSMHLYVNH